MKLDVTYSEKGEAIPDLKVAEWFDNLLKDMKLVTNLREKITINVGTEAMINAIRVGIVTEQLNHNDVTIRFKDEQWQFDKDGRCTTWPQGFCDTNTDYIVTLLGW